MVQAVFSPFDQAPSNALQDVPLERRNEHDDRQCGAGEDQARLNSPENSYGTVTN
jgi:hypothetical protein